MRICRSSGSFAGWNRVVHFSPSIDRTWPPVHE
jgi:hypothetical protein